MTDWLYAIQRDDDCDKAATTDFTDSAVDAFAQNDMFCRGAKMGNVG